MYCTNCGKIIPDTAKFCNYCGTPIVNQANPIPAPVTSENVEETTTAETPVFAENSSVAVETVSENNLITENPITPESTLSAPTENIAENTAPEFNGNPLPTPNVIPNYGSADIPSYTSANTVPISGVAKQENKPERRYTLGHIIMCLAAAAVFAITAGIFAGLYFSAM